MSEPEFELYLSLISKFLRLNTVQKHDITEELRVHLDDRLAELTAQGKSRDEAIRLALDEFGDAGALAWQFTLPHSLRRRRQIMRYSIGSFVALAGIFTLVTLTWPNRPDRPPEVQTVVAQGKTHFVGLGIPSAPEATDQTLMERREIEEKLSSREFEYTFVEVPIGEALQSLSQQTQLPFIYSLSDPEVFGETRVNLEAPKGTLTIRSAIELILRHQRHDLTYSIRDGVILISDSNEDYEVQVYDCRDLLAGVQVQGAMQAGGSGMGGGGMGGGFFSVPAELAAVATTQAFGPRGRAGDEDDAPAGRGKGPGGMGGRGGMGGGMHTTSEAAATSMAGAALIGVLQSATKPAQWINTDGEGGSMSEFDGVIVVRHHQAVHRKIEDVLSKLRKVKRVQQLAVRPEDVKSLKIPPGKRLVTLNANWQLPVNSIRSGSRVDIVRINDGGGTAVIMSNVEVVLPNITPLMTGFGTQTSWQVNAVNLIVTPEEALELLNTESLTPHPLKFVLRSEEGDDDDRATEERKPNLRERSGDATEIEEREGDDGQNVSRSVELNFDQVADTIRAGLPEAVRDQVKILVEPHTVDFGSPRFYPLVGQVQLLHLHYRCTVDYSNVAPRERPAQLTKADTFVFMHDVDHLFSAPRWK